MKWSLKIGTVLGIPVFVHWTFLILLGWIFVSHLTQGQGVQMAIEGTGFLLAIFACVLLHEFGHAVAAKRYGVRTRDVTLLPIGGVARLERIPESPKQELVIASAGPLVNVVIALLLALTIVIFRRIAALEELSVVGGPFLTKLMYVNIALVAFNVLPAFPMDGGRVLRALLAFRMDYVRATQIASSIGQGMAVIFGILGFFYNWFLMFIALFVYLGAQQEAHMVSIRSLLRGVPVRAAMVRRFRTLSADDPLSRAIEELLDGEQQDFPILEDEQVAGVLTRSELIKALAEGKTQALVRDVMVKNCEAVEDTEMLGATYEKMREAGCPILPVLRHGKLCGMLTIENVGEWLMVHSSLREAKSRSEIDDILHT